MLLVGGDSFAQFPKTDWVLETKSSKACTNWDGNILHWCELLAQEKNIDSISVGIAGGDSSITSYETIRQLYNNTSITHCIFFITSPFRTAIRDKSSKSESELKRRFAHYDDRWMLAPAEYYSTVLTDNIFLPGSHYASIDRECGQEIEHNQLWHRIDRIPEHEFIQKQLNSLATISTMAKTRGISIVFCSGFPPGIPQHWVTEELRDQYFDSTGACGVTMSQPELRSHHNAAEHKFIFEIFKKTVKTF
tara:strand:- start:85 stop:831 length:747 start_codon:yes stop_codon:yes gene_type:complete